MANTKVTQHVIANNAITADQIASAAVTDAKLHSTLDLSGKTLTLPATAIPSASTATTQAASDNSTKIATTAYVTTAVANLVDSSPSSLDTLNELAAALNDDASFSTTVTNSIATKLPLAGGTMTGAIAMGTSKITGLGDPTASQDAGTKTYIDTADALKLNLTGGTLTGDLILNTTTALKIPAGTTGQRPSAATGQIRWNTTDGALEVYNGSAWTAVGTGSSNKVLDTFTGDGSTTDFTLSVTPANEDALMVFIDGVYQEKGDYVLTNAVLALDTAPASGEKIACHITTASVHDGTSALNQQFTATSGQTAFTLSQDPKSENNTQVYINGVYQQKTDYTVSGTTLTFDTGLTVGDVVEVNMFTVATLGNTDTVSEGSSNLYHTTARARSAISVSGNALSYNSSTGVITSAYEESPTFTGTVTSAGLAVDTDTLFVDSSANNVGVGATSLQSWAKLEVAGTAGAQDGAKQALYVRAPTTTANEGVGIRLSAASGSNEAVGIIGMVNNASGNAGSMTFHTYNLGATIPEAMRIDNTGKVGIGTTTPSQLLTVEGSSFPILQISNTDANNPANAVALDLVEKQTGYAAATATFGQTGVYGYRLKLDGSTNDLILQSGSQTTVNDRITIKRDTGNVGIGVVPETWQSTIDVLQVGLGASFAGNTTNPSRTYLSANSYINSSNQESYIATDEASQYFQNAGTHIFKVAPSGTADSAVTWTTAMTIDNSGKVGIGSSPSHTLTVDASGGANFAVSRTGVADMFYVEADGTNAVIRNPGSNDLVFQFGGTSEKIRFDGPTGTITATGGALASPTYSFQGDTSTGMSRPTGSAINFVCGGTERARVTANGITFNGDTAAANALDDYEEGTFDASITPGSGNYTLNAGYSKLGYTKVGRIVTITGQVVISAANSASGAVTIGDLPFEMLNDTQRSSQTRPSIHIYANGSGAPAAGYYSAFIAFNEGNRSGTLIVTYNNTHDATVGDWLSGGSDLFINFAYHAA